MVLVHSDRMRCIDRTEPNVYVGENNRIRTCAKFIVSSHCYLSQTASPVLMWFAPASLAHRSIFQVYVEEGVAVYMSEWRKIENACM